MEISQKKLTFASPHSRSSLKVIGIDTDQLATYDFLLVFHSNYGPMSYRFRDKKRYNCKFPAPGYLTPPPTPRGFPL